VCVSSKEVTGTLLDIYGFITATVTRVETEFCHTKFRHNEIFFPISHILCYSIEPIKIKLLLFRKFERNLQILSNSETASVLEDAATQSTTFYISMTYATTIFISIHTYFKDFIFQQYCKFQHRAGRAK
jgi:hypothetical protein